jgi:hypothetical protein
MATGFAQKCNPNDRSTSEPVRDSLNDRWPGTFGHVMSLPEDQLDRLEWKLMQLRQGVGVTVPQMSLLRAIAARRIAQHFDEVHRKARA